MRLTSFKKDGWVLIIPALLIVSGFTRDPVHTLALRGALLMCLVVAIVSIVGGIRWYRRSRTPQPERVET